MEGRKRDRVLIAHNDNYDDGNDNDEDDDDCYGYDNGDDNAENEKVVGHSEDDAWTGGRSRQ